MSDETKPTEIINRGEFSLFAAQLRHDSIVVVEVPHKLTEAGVKNLQEIMRKNFPRHRRVILDSGMTVRVIHPAPDPEDPEPVGE